MKKKKINKKGRYIVVLKNNTKTSINKIQNELGIALTSSVELNSKVRAHNIMSNSNGIIYKNLGVAVVDNIEKAKLEFCVNSSKIPVLHWEEEQEFRTTNELEQIKKISRSMKRLQGQIDGLEKIVKKRLLEAELKNLSWTWGLEAINLPQTKYTGKGIDVVILDTGFYAAHPDFSNRTVIGKSFIQNEDWDFDGNGHGTHCTGTALGFVSKQENKRYGIAHEANIVIGKVLSDAGSGSTSGIVDAIDWAIEKKYRIVSMSLGSRVQIGQKPSFIFEQVGKRALSKNCLLIAAAGNDSRRPQVPKPVSSPANALSIMAVAALDKNLKVAKFSNGGINAADGGRVDIAAPGVKVFSAWSENAKTNAGLYRSINGTSMATPHVSGLAALYMEAHPGLSAKRIWTKLEQNAKSLSPQKLRDIGKGLAQSV